MKGRARLVAGAGALALAGLVAWIGYLRISIEPALNRQLPYLASAGMAVVVLAVLGGALVLADQVRSDDTRIEELERAVTLLAGALAGSIEAPPRRAAPATPATSARKTPAKKRATAKKKAAPRKVPAPRRR